MGFQFNDTTIEVEIEGKTYTVDPGSAEMQDALTQASLAATTVDVDAVEAGTECLAASNALRNIVAAIIGETNAREVFENRAPNVVNELELVAYLKGEVAKAPASKKLESFADLAHVLQDA